MQRKWLIGIGIAVVVVALVVGALLVRPKPVTDQAAEGQAASGSTAPEDGASSSSGSPEVPGESAEEDEELSGPPPAIAEDGAKLADVNTPPDQTLAMLDVGSATAGSRYVVVFRPYGTAAAGLVIAVESSAPEQKPAKPYDFKGRNVLVEAGEGERATVAAGGTYEGVVELRQEADVLIPVLVSAKRQ